MHNRANAILKYKWSMAYADFINAIFTSAIFQKIPEIFGYLRFGLVTLLPTSPNQAKLCFVCKKILYHPH